MVSKINNPWDEAGRKVLRRVNPSTGKLENLDRGVNYFIIALEALGARTLYSCEGHPFGFYISFEGSYELAIQVQKAGFFQVEVEERNCWSLRLGRNETGLDRGASWNERKKRQVLRRVATSWKSMLEQ